MAQITLLTTAVHHGLAASVWYRQSDLGVVVDRELTMVSYITRVCFLSDSTHLDC